MISVIRGLFVDIEAKVDRMISSLDNQTLPTKAASQFKQDTLVGLHDIKKQIAEILQSTILNDSWFVRNLMIKYNFIRDSLLEIELYRYLPINKYNTRSYGHFEKLIQRIYTEIESQQSVPFVCAISNSDSYYWAYPKFYMIAVPEGEEQCLLNLSDLYHEVGHFIFDYYELHLVEKHRDNLRNHFANNTTNAVADALELWTSSWTEEIACDLIATYLVGPAYAWTNIKISAVSSSANEVFGFPRLGDAHPPDSTRMCAIFAMLKLMGMEEETKPILKAWDELCQKIHNQKPAMFDMMFPNKLIDSIAANVFEGCQNITLRSYSEQLTIFDTPVSLIVNQAWEQVLNHPDTFSTWESEQVYLLSYD